MRTRSANPEKSDSAKKVGPKKGVAKTPTKTDVADPVKETGATPTDKKVGATSGVKVSKTEEQQKQITPKTTTSKSGEAETQAEGAKEAKGNTATPKSVDKNSAMTGKAKTSGSSGKEESQNIEGAVSGKDKEEPSSSKSAAVGSEMKVENTVRTEEKSVEPIENEEESGGGEGVDEEVEPQEMDQEGGEMEEYDEGDFEVAEGEHGDYEEDVEAGEDAAGEDEEHHEMEMPAVVQERRKKKELEVFVGGLDKDAVEEDIRKVFLPIGEVLEVRLLRNPLTNKNKGFAFVRFATTEQAKRAVDEMKNPVIRGKRCGVAPSEDNDTLFLGNICKTWTKEAVKNKLKDYGVDGLEELTLVGDTQNEGLSRGFAFLEFSTHYDAMNAYKRLQKPDVIFGGERTAKVAFAEPLREPDAEVMAQVKSVFVDGLPPFWDEERVKEHLKGFGEIEKVVLARNMPTAKRRDFGFVNFISHEQAEACIEGLNNTMIIDGDAKLKVKVRLANPLPKSQAVKGGMRGGFPIGRSGIGIRTRPGWKLGVARAPFKKVGMSRGRGFMPRGRARGVPGRGGRISLRDDDDVNSLFRTFREQLIHDERQAPTGRGRRAVGALRRGSYRSYTRQNDAYHSRTAATTRVGEDIPTRTVAGVRPVAYKDSYGSRRGGLARPGARPIPPRRQSFPPSEDLYSRRLDRDVEHSRLRPDPYAYEDVHPGTKRSYSEVDEHLGYAEPGRAPARTRYDYSAPITSGTRYSGQQTLAGGYDGLVADSTGGGSGLYSSGYAGASDYYRTDLGDSSYSSLYGGSRTLGRGSYY
uniref:RRM domain-containing protein n=1 Tax=Araucaria cunninghamii TaxID=56994 RepID=A0A0D6QY14_ARACU